MKFVITILILNATVALVQVNEKENTLGKEMIGTTIKSSVIGASGGILMNQGSQQMKLASKVKGLVSCGIKLEKEAMSSKSQSLVNLEMSKNLVGDLDDISKSVQHHQEAQKLNQKATQAYAESVRMQEEVKMLTKGEDLNKFVSKNSLKGISKYALGVSATIFAGLDLVSTGVAFYESKSGSTLNSSGRLTHVNHGERSDWKDINENFNQDKLEVTSGMAQ